MMIDRTIWKMMFNKVMDPTIKHIQQLLTEPLLMRNCKYLCLAGGLSTSPYFQYRINEEFGPKSKYKLQLITPQRPLLSVVEGAAYFAINDNYIKARKLRYTYGEMVHKSIKSAEAAGVPQEYIEKNKYFDDRDQKWWVRDCFKIMAYKGQEIFTGDIIKNKGARLSCTTKSVSTRIMVSKMEDPKVKDDGTILGMIKNAFPDNNKDDMHVMLEFHFYCTIIKAVTYRLKEPEKKETKYITNYV